jgi:hypothetical protein
MYRLVSSSRRALTVADITIEIMEVASIKTIKAIATATILLRIERQDVNQLKGCGRAGPALEPIEQLCFHRLEEDQRLLVSCLGPLEFGSMQKLR